MGTVTGVIVWIAGPHVVGRTLIVFGCASMVAAAAVLLASNRAMARAAAMQGVLPLIAVALIW